jgi:succinyl-diaminopimelate desuccinylase
VFIMTKAINKKVPAPYLTIPQLKTLSHLQTLIRFKSITPNSAGGVEWLAHQLTDLGFSIEQFSAHNVTNLIAKISFGAGPVVAFSGHIDVVPAAQGGWLADPFDGKIINDAIYGRGAADMKGGIAAMLSATQSLIHSAQQKQGTLYWLITSDEEGEAEHGSVLIAKRLAQQAGHVAYPENTINAAHISAEVVNRLTQIDWLLDEPSSKTSLQVTGINIDNVLDNLVPAQCNITFNIRYSHGYKSTDVKQLVLTALNDLNEYLTVQWERPCEPYYTSHRAERCLLAQLEQAIFNVTGSYPVLSTSGGTSDGRFFASKNTQVIECGVLNQTIHQVNEHVPISDLLQIEKIYTQLLVHIFSQSNNEEIR